MSVRQTAVAVGVLFLVATATFLAADTIIHGVLRSEDAWTNFSAHAAALDAAALLAFADGLAVVGIAVLLYPLLREHGERLALGYVALRVGELAVVALCMTVPLFLVALGEAGAGSANVMDATSSARLGVLVASGYEVALRMLFLFTGAAGIVLGIVLCRSQLVPRPLAALGVFGYALLLAGTALYMFRAIDLFEGIGTLVAWPVGLFELILPLWLIARGFDARAVAAHPVEHA